MDTSAGFTLTIADLMELAKGNDAMVKVKLAGKQEKEVDMSQSSAEAVERTRSKRLRLQPRYLAYHVHHYQNENIHPKALQVRRQIARKRICALRAAVLKCTA